MKAMIKQYRAFPWQYSLDRPGWNGTYGQAFADLLETYIDAGSAAYHSLRKTLFPAIGEPGAHGFHGLTRSEKQIVDTMIRDFATDPGWWTVKANPRRRY
jgi:hypothetical protein